MSKPTSAVKRKYNKSVYHRYEFTVNMATKLDYLVEKYKSQPSNSLSDLIRQLLCQYFGIDYDEIYVHSRYIRNDAGEWIIVPNNDL